MKILFIDACVSAHTPSRTKILCERYLEQYRQQGAEIKELQLTELGLKPLTAAEVAARTELSKVGFEAEMFALARQFRAADLVVVGAPYWDLSFPSVLKIYIEHIMVTGLTFQYVGSEAVGLCQAEKLVYIMTAGGFVGEQNFGYDYMRAIGNMLGIRQSELICAEGLDLPGADVDAILKQAF